MTPPDSRSDISSDSLNQQARKTCCVQRCLLLRYPSEHAEQSASSCELTPEQGVKVRIIDTGLPGSDNCGILFVCPRPRTPTQASLLSPPSQTRSPWLLQADCCRKSSSWARLVAHDVLLPSLAPRYQISCHPSRSEICCLVVESHSFHHEQHHSFSIITRARQQLLDNYLP